MPQLTNQNQVFQKADTKVLLLWSMRCRTRKRDCTMWV